MSDKFKFKVGDRVVAIEDALPFKIKGKHGVIIKCDSSFDHLDYGVEFDEYIGGHSCGGFPGNDGKTGHCAWIRVDGVVAEKSSDNWKVVIIPDGDKTIGKLIENGKTVKEVTTRKHPDD